MERVLHTADVHLRSNSPERRDALESVLEHAERNSFDVVTVGGDLFDAPEDVETLRPELRNDLFADRAIDIVLIPGNHDVEAYRGDEFFGDACTVLTTSPFEHWLAPSGDLRITGLPYRESADDALLLELQNRADFDGTEVLLVHCSLDVPFDDVDSGEGEGHHYFPLTEQILEALGFDYYLAGHYHGPHKLTLANGAEFTYPGTPASTSVTETGQRRVNTLLQGEGLGFESLDTFHYLRKAETVTPGTESTLLEKIEDWAASTVRESANASVRVDGFVQLEESTFHDRLTDAAAPATVENNTRSVAHLESHQLFAAFESELAETDWAEDTKTAVTRRTLEVFTQLSAQGDL